MQAGLVLWWTVIFVAVVVAFVRMRGRRRLRGGERGRRRGVGSAAVGTVYDLLNEDKRNAVEIIVEGHAEERPPEYPAGNLPELEQPGGKTAKAPD